MQLLKPCVQSADNQNRNETQSALRDIWYDLLCALAVCFVFLQLALVCASFLSRVEGHGDVISSLLGYKCVSLKPGLSQTLVLCKQSWTRTISVMLW